MKRKEKNGQERVWRVLDAVSGRVMRDREGEVVTVKAFTEKAAKLRAKLMFSNAVVVEAV